MERWISIASIMSSKRSLIYALRLYSPTLGYRQNRNCRTQLHLLCLRRRDSNCAMHKRMPARCEAVTWAYIHTVLLSSLVIYLMHRRFNGRPGTYYRSLGIVKKSQNQLSRPIIPAWYSVTWTRAFVSHLALSPRCM